MRAKDIVAAGRVKKHVFPYRNVNEDMPVVNVLPLLLDTPEGLLGVRSGNGFEGVIDRDSLLEGLGRMIAPRDDCSVITLECVPADYSASRIAHAVEDSDAHLVDMWSTPSEDGKIQVTLHRQSIALSVTVMMSFPLMATATATATVNWRHCAFLS